MVDIRKKDEFLGVHYRAEVAFTLRPANAAPPGLERIVQCSLASEEPELQTEAQWKAQFVRDWCQGNEEHRLVWRKPAVVPWRAWYLHCMELDSERGNNLQRRWRQWLREMAWDQLSPLQKLAFDGSLHEIEPIVKNALEQGSDNPFLKERNILFYVVLSNSTETLSFLLRFGGFADPQQLRKGETWTGFTALHAALFIRNKAMMALLWNAYRANVNAKDHFFGSVLDYTRLLGMVGNAEVYFRGSRSDTGHSFGYHSLNYIAQVTLRHPYSFDTPERDQFELRNVADASKVSIPYWNKKSKEMERMPLLEWVDLVRADYQPFVSAKDSWLDELMFNGVYVADPTPELRRRYADHLNNALAYETPTNVFMSYINSKIGFGCFALRDLAPGEWVLTSTGRLHNDRPKWKDVERTTQFRLNFMRQIHDLGEKGKDVLQKQEIPRYPRDPCYNLRIPGTSYYLNSTECGNMGRILNHSSRPNSKIVVVWNAGIPQALVVAVEPISRGQQIYVDYRDGFWSSDKDEPASKQHARVSLWNYNGENTLATADSRLFFAASHVVEMRETDDFPNRINVSE